MVWEPLLTLLIGRVPVMTDLILPGYVLRGGHDAFFPDLHPGTGKVAGVLVSDLTAAEVDRITYFAGGLSHDPVRSEGVTAFVARAEGAPGADWDREIWREKWGETALFAVDEVLSHAGTISPARLKQMMPMILVRASARAAAMADTPTEVRSALRATEVEVTERHNRHAGFFLTREYALRHPTLEGGMSPEVRREVFVATDAAIVLPYDPVRDRVLLVEQFRMGPYGRGDPRPWMLEPVAGRVDPGEAPEVTARRECTEEAGLSLRGLEHISSHYCSPGCSTEYFHCYLGLCDLADLAPGRGGLESEDEDIRTHVLSFERAMGLIPSGEAANGPLILCLLWLERERARLRANAGSGA